MQAFCEIFMHWPPHLKSRPPRQEDSPFGHVLGYMFKVETNSRGTLHTHGNIIQPFLQPRRLESVFSDPCMRIQLLDFLEHIACHHAGNGCTNSRSN
ncbi:hypothetical protein DUNSADRAFT_3068 [Dunaliella salina]|uniref:Helitron helicase-like domain-containing protein n=1 Tax=Dunaliella salina TaxID=3046 RepID=A0ABQ7FVP1_DUNSA|nr:hypothetical protein DUNSADRAFT_3068 [Dunaliella salina]|eukprot:KAF5826444.1 hypothetical protein DUNSADRAFT_3068 [Dunaliella salina]